MVSRNWTPAIPSPSVSVIIPVFNDPERLGICLNALEQQTYSADSYETIVIDNGSDASVEPIVARFRHAVLIEDGRPSQFAARNTGISLAKGEIIAFIDADCIPHSNWIERGVMNLLRVPNCGLVAGKVEVFFRDPKRPTAVELYEGLTALTQKRYVEIGHFGATANLFTHKHVLERVGLFDDETKSGADVEWGQRVFSFGYDLIYADDAIVAHPARHSLGELCRMVSRRIGGVHDLKRRRRCYFLGIDRGFIGDLLPPVRYSITVLFDRKLKSWIDRIKVIAVIFLVRYVEALERVRLRLGGTSRR